MAKAELTVITGAIESDAEKIALLESEAFGDEALSVDNVKNNILDPQVCVYVARVANEFAGYCIIHFAADEGELSTIAVRETFRGQRIAQQLLETALNDNNLIKNLFLEVRESNISAQNLYKRMGFEEVGIRKNFYNNPTENALLLALHKQ